MLKLSKQHRLFIEAYDGDEVYAMRCAGYEGADLYLKQKALELLSTPLVKEALAERGRYDASLNSLKASREERQIYWTQLMRNQDPHIKPEVGENGKTIPPPANIPYSIRIKATELLGRSEQDFVEKLEIDAKMSISQVIEQSYSITDQNEVNDIEAIYNQIYTKKVRSVVNEAVPEGPSPFGDDEPEEHENFESRESFSKSYL